MLLLIWQTDELEHRWCLSSQWWVLKILGWTTLWLKGCPRKSCRCLQLFSSRDKEGLLGCRPCSHGGLTQMAIYPRFMRGNRDWCRGNRRKVSNVLYFNNYQLTMSCIECHVVTLKSVVRSVPVPWARYSKKIRSYC